MRVVIIEDEILTAEDLEHSIKELRSDYEIVKVLHSVEESKTYLRANNSFDLIFSDVHLGDGLSFEIFDSVKVSVPIIFCTAYDNYALNAFKSNGIDYILKPINKKGLNEGIEKFERIFNSGKKQISNISELIETYKKIEKQHTAKSILVHVKDKIIPLKFEEIALFYIKNETTIAVDFKGLTYYLEESLEEIESLNEPSFFRANRQFIVNRASVKDLTQHFARKLIVNLTIPFTEQIVLSKEKAPQFLNWVKNI